MSEEEEGHRDEVEIVEEDELEQLKGKVAELEQELQYYAADISNIRQKAAKDRSQAIRFGSSSLAKKILPLLSGMERAINQSEGGKFEGFLEGTKMTLKGFKTALESEGVTHIESMGEQFDPTKMEAVAMLPAPAVSNHASVLAVCRTTTIPLSPTMQLSAPSAGRQQTLV